VQRAVSGNSVPVPRLCEPIDPFQAEVGPCCCFTVAMRRASRFLSGGSVGNEQLTAIVATLLLVLLAIEGATLLHLRSLLTVHAFVGVLLIPVVVVKLASVGWKMARYYLNHAEYVRRGPPHVVLRMLVAPVVVVSTLTLFVSGIALLVHVQTTGPMVGLHKASFVVWFGAMSVHVLTRIATVTRLLFRPLPGIATRIAVVGGALAAGVVLAMATLPAADHLQDVVGAHMGVDAH
jgi:hypothetical protein